MYVFPPRQLCLRLEIHYSAEHELKPLLWLLETRSPSLPPLVLPNLSIIAFSYLIVAFLAMYTATEEHTMLRYHVCVRCNKRHTHKRFQGKKPHTDVPSDWKEVIGYYTNKHTGKPIALKDSPVLPIMCHSCHKQYVNRSHKRPAPSSKSPIPSSAKRPCRALPELTFDEIVDVFLSLSSPSTKDSLSPAVAT